MLATLVWENLKRDRKKKLLSVLSVVTGIGLETALLNVTLGINDHLGQELRRYGANILVVPEGELAPLSAGGVRLGGLGEGRTLDESALPALLRIFWRNNLLGVSPYLYAPACESQTGRSLLLVGTWFGGTFGGGPGNGGAGLPGARGVPAGARAVSPWWRVDGRWPDDTGGDTGAGAVERCRLLLGADLAADLRARPGDRLELSCGERFLLCEVAGILHTGGFEEGQAFAHLGAVQRLVGRPGAVAKVLVSALTVPEEKALRDLDALTPAERERWSCTPYPSTIARQLQNALPGCRAEPILAVTRAEGRFLSKVHLLLVLVTALALLAAALGVATTMSSVILARRQEIALMRTLGGGTRPILLQFLAESCLLGLAGGLAGYGLGVLLSQVITLHVFGVPGSVVPSLLPLMLLLSCGIVFAGCLRPILTTLALQPILVLKEGA
ncbi:MAG: ABC transporter permease [Planctomycetes bacterium]|nr:ABC transporter permease [Planctomycetota bacterium]